MVCLRPRREKTREAQRQDDPNYRGGSGIGEALAQRLHDRGNTVIVVGRRRDALGKACAGRDGMSAMELDVADAQAIEDFARRATAAHPSLDVLVNNAGIMRAETLDERDLADAGATVTTNLLGRSASSTA